MDEVSDTVEEEVVQQYEEEKTGGRQDGPRQDKCREEVRGLNE